MELAVSAGVLMILGLLEGLTDGVERGQAPRHPLQVEPTLAMSPLRAWPLSRSCHSGKEPAGS